MLFFSSLVFGEIKSRGTWFQPFFPPSIVVISVLFCHPSSSFHDFIFELPYVTLTCRPFYLAFPLYFIMFPVAHIFLPIFPGFAAMPVHFTVDPISMVGRTVSEFHLAESVLVPICNFTDVFLVKRMVLPRFSALSMLCTFWPLTNVFVAFRLKCALTFLSVGFPLTEVDVATGIVLLSISGSLVATPRSYVLWSIVSTLFALTISHSVQPFTLIDWSSINMLWFSNLTITLTASGCWNICLETFSWVYWSQFIFCQHKFSLCHLLLIAV